MKIVIEGNKINSLNDFYDQLEEYMDAGECPWTRDLDSLDEIVANGFNYTDDPALTATEIIWNDTKHSKEKLGLEETIKWWRIPATGELSPEYNDGIATNIAQLKAGKGELLYDMLIEILVSNNDITFRAR